MPQVAFSTAAAPGQANEDYVAAGAGWVMVLDGATAARGLDSGCRHNVRWLVEHLAAHLASPLTLGTTAPLTDVLAGAIAAVRGDHDDTCDLDNPHSPSATVAMLRRRGNAVDHLVLADSAVVLDVGGEVTGITDDRLDHLPGYTAETVGAHRNHDAGFWVASTSIDAAYQAMTGTVPVSDVRRAAVVSDGVSRYVELLGLGGWTDLLDALSTDGPSVVIDQVRAAESAQLGDDPRGPSGRRIKKHDDATAAYVTF